MPVNVTVPDTVLPPDVLLMVIGPTIEEYGPVPVPLAAASLKYKIAPLVRPGRTKTSCVSPAG